MKKLNPNEQYTMYEADVPDGMDIDEDILNYDDLDDPDAFVWRIVMFILIFLIVGGGVGAIVGAATRPSKSVILSLSVRIVTSNIQNPLHIIPVITTETKRSSDQYKQGIELANEIYATFVSIINTNKSNMYIGKTR